MINFKPGDVIIFELQGYGIFKPLVHWLLGSKWGHIGLFYAYTKRDLPLIIESIGRGVLIRSLLASCGRKIKVMRWQGKDAEQVGLKVAKSAEHIADNPSSWYGYLDIPRYVLPRLIWQKITGKKEGFGYWHNSFFICSELVAQAFRDADSPLFTGNYIPLPGDFVNSKFLKQVWEGKL